MFPNELEGDQAAARRQAADFVRAELGVELSVRMLFEAPCTGARSPRDLTGVASVRAPAASS